MFVSDVIAAQRVICNGFDFESVFQNRTPRLWLNCDWRGDPTPLELQTSVSILWDDNNACFGFECSYTEMDMDDPSHVGFNVEMERYGLWERDVCEVFIRSPRESGIKAYLEFEAAPNGQWCDLKIDRSARLRDWEWRSGMQVVHQIEPALMIYRILLIIPFKAFDVFPRSGDYWYANLFRIGRLSGIRQYLTYSPTLTEQPNFHVPERFVKLLFL